MSWELFDQLKRRLAAGDAEAVLEPLQALRQQWPEPALATVRADALAQLGRHEEALACLQADLDAGIANHWTHYSLGHHLARQGQIAAAAAAFRRCHGLQGWSASEERGYTFSHDYFSGHIPQWRQWFADLITIAPIRILEVGSWQGGSTLWLLDHVVGPRGGQITCVDTWNGSAEHTFLQPLGLALEDLFDANVTRTGLGDQVRKIKGRSEEVLPALEAGRFDLIYIDGAHEAKTVIQDAIHAHRLLAPGGFLLFDDLQYQCADPTQHTSRAIDFFCQTFAADYHEWHRGAQLLLQRRPPQPEPPTPPLPERLLLVLGMHRSGTSALSGALCQLGICAPSDPEPASPANPTGHWEPPAILACHEALLAEAQSSWDDPLMPAQQWAGPRRQSHQQTLAAALQASFPHRKPGQVVLVKDPRQCRLQPLWNGLLEQHSLEAAVLLLLRHPLAVAQSLQRRDQLPIDRSLLLWLTHTLEAERHTRQHRRCVVVYEQLLEAPVPTLQCCLGLAGLEAAPVDPAVLARWIRADLNHATSTGNSADSSAVADRTLLDLALEVYQRLAAAHGTAPDEPLVRWLNQAHEQLEQRLQALRSQCSRREMVQLFWEPSNGGGFREDQSLRTSVEVDRGVSTVTLTLPAEATAPSALRLDPAEQPGLIQLQRLALLDAHNQVLWEGQHSSLSPANPQTAILSNGEVLAANHDPGLLLLLPATVLQQLGEGCSLQLQARWQPLSRDVALQLLESTKDQQPMAAAP